MSVVDFHTHILPALDDGSESTEQSVAMLKKQAEQGISSVIVTPHFYASSQSPTEFLENREAAVNRLKEAAKDVSGLPSFRVGAEVHFFEGISDCEFLHDMAIEGTDCVLIEMPMKQWSDRILRELSGIRRKRKLTPIIAHIDRYMGPFRSLRLPERIMEHPVLIQANSSFFIRKGTRRTALKMLERGMIHLLGSDCHNLKERAPNLGEAVDIITDNLGENFITRINKLENKLLIK